MTTRITLGANAIAKDPVTIDLPDDKALEYATCLNMIDEQRQAAGTTPLTITSIQEVP